MRPTAATMIVIIIFFFSSAGKNFTVLSRYQHLNPLSSASRSPLKIRILPVHTTTMWLVSRSGKPTPTIFCDSEWAKMLWSKRRIYSEEHISFPAPRDISRHFLSKKSFRRSMNMAKVPWRHWWQKEAAARRRKKKVSLPLLPRACLSPPSLSPVSVPPPPPPPKWRPFSSFPGGSGEGEATKAAFFGAMAASQIAAACSVAAPRVEGTERRGEASPPAGGGRKRPRSFSPICSANSVVSSSPVSMEHLIHFLCPLIIRTNATVAPSPLLFGFRTRPFD